MQWNSIKWQRHWGSFTILPWHTRHADSYGDVTYFDHFAGWLCFQVRWVELR